MVRQACGFLLLLTAPALLAQPERFGVDPRVELMSVIFRLAGNREYSQGRIPSYNAAIDRHFANFHDHEAIRLARELHQTDGVSYDAVINMAVHLKDAVSLEELVPFDTAKSLDSRWHGAKARRFVAAARKFVADSDFAGFVNSQQPLYDLTNTRLRAFIEKNTDLGWFDRFFGARNHSPFLVAPGLVNGGASYGASVTVNGQETIYAAPGIWKVDQEGMPDFDPGWASTLVHEFAHSYVGPLLDAYKARLGSAGDSIYTAAKKEMDAQAYGSGLTVLNESLVRAATARYAFDHHGAEAGARAVREERARYFLWTGELYDLLGAYASNRAQYPTMLSFMPSVAACFEDLGARIKDIVRKYEEGRPNVLSISVVNGATDVDPELKEIVVRFDRPMNKEHYAVARTSNVAMPKLGKVSFDESGRVFTIPVTLEPGKEYAFSLNWPGGGSFESTEGVLLRAVEVKFKTK